MKRRIFLKNSSGLIAALAASPLLAEATVTKNHMEQQNNPAVITHYVLFWLNEGLSDQEVKDFTGFFEELRKVPTIKSLHYGPPVASTSRDVVDNSFSYNLLVYFNTLEDLEVYGTHPIHLQAIEKYSKYWNKVVVHDSSLK